MTAPVPAPAANVSRRSWWLVIATALLALAFLFGAMIGPAGPAWWRVPLELLDRLPFVSIDSGASKLQSTVLWQIRMPRVVLAGIVGAMLS
ncbi:MAG: iron ABC transporter permease, partial [Actinomycetota bacterium]